MKFDLLMGFLEGLNSNKKIMKYRLSRDGSTFSMGVGSMMTLENGRHAYFVNVGKKAYYIEEEPESTIIYLAYSSTIRRRIDISDNVVVEGADQIGFTIGSRLFPLNNEEMRIFEKAVKKA